MVAYVVSTINVHDPETYRKYTPHTAELIKRHGGRFLTRGGDVTTIEGEPFTDRLLILEFPDKEHAEAFFKDPDYVAIAEFRHQSSTARILVQEGVSSSENPPANV